MVSALISILSTSRWRKAFEVGTQETNPQRIRQLVAAAEEAIIKRWQQLTTDDDVEREQLAEAAATLWT